jgi:hypothetical protein
MVQANVRQVFIGIESPRRSSLTETRKLQNVTRDSIEARIQRIRDGGLVVQAGFIVGFDHDDEDIFEEQFRFIQRLGAAQAIVSLLVPVPTTPLYDRLLREGRIDFSDPQVIYHPRLMTREALKEGYAGLVRRLYEPEAYFERLFAGLDGSPSFRRRRAAHDRLVSHDRGVAAKLSALVAGVRQAVGLGAALARAGRVRDVGGAYLRVWRRRNRALGRDAIPFEVFVSLCVMHWHYFNIAALWRKAGFGIVRPEPIEHADVRASAGMA